jgi:hypothetical protein
MKDGMGIIPDEVVGCSYMRDLNLAWSRVWV